MGNSLLQASFTGGEIGPALYGRVDLSRYQTSLKTCRNFIAQQYGGVTNRAGFRFVAEVKDSSKATVLLPFAFSTVQTYILEFGNLYFRVMKDGGQVVETTVAITGATQANPVVITAVAHGYTTGQEVFLQSLGGMRQVNGRNFKITVLTANTFSLQDLAGNNINGTAYTAYTSGGTAARVYTVTSTYLEADLDELNYTQSADVMTVVNQSYRPRQVSRTGHAAWTIADFANANGPFQDINTTATTVYSDAATGSVTLTASASLFAANMIGSLFFIEQKDYGQPWVAGEAGILVGDIRRSDGKYYESQTAATCGTVRPVHDADDWSDGAVTWRFLHPGFGVCLITAVGGATSATATVISRIPDDAVGAGGATYKWAKEAWGIDQGYPAATTYFQQRQIFGGTTGQPQTAWMSKIGNYVDFGYSQPQADDDSITLPVPARQVNAIRHLLPLDQLSILTSGAEFIVGAGQSEVLSPATVTSKPQGYRGSSKVPPIIIGSTAIFLQDKGKSVYELSYDFATDKYTGNDLTIPGAHLLVGHRIVAWAYQQVPFQVIWAVRDDGVLLGLTYLREQQVAGWHRHDTDGYFESVATISDGDEDALYAVIRRTINGVTKRYIERMESRTFSSIKDAFFVDSGLTYDGRNTTATTMTISGGVTWEYETETYTLTASAGYFAATDVGSEIHFEVGEQVIRLAITAYKNTTVVWATANRDVPVSLRAVATASWGHARSVFTTLWHLEAKTCSVLADGNVHPTVVVSSGAATLGYAAVVVHIGLPIQADFETLSVNVSGNETLLDKKKLIPCVRLLVESSRGIFVGPDADHLLEYKQRAGENYDEATDLTTGVIEVRTQAEWNRNGTCFVRQDDPLPLTILAAIPEVSVGGA